MRPCPAVLNLYGDDIHCEHAAGHPGPHYTEALTPDGVAWTDRTAA